MKSYSKRLLSTFLAVIMVAAIVSSFTLASSAATAITTGDIIEYGSYPQTKVMDTVLIGTGEKLIDILGLETLSADNTVTYEGAKYKKVNFTVITNANQEANGYVKGETYWFKFEPIQWRVLSNTSGELFVMAEKILDTKAYNQSKTSITWEDCSLRAWLNGDFYNTAFNTVEQAGMLTSTVVNDDDTFYGTNGGNTTNDKLFLISYAESINSSYGFGSAAKFDFARRAQGTDYAKSTGLKVNTAGSDTLTSNWWLRTPGYISMNAVYVFSDGYVGNYNDDVSINATGARPAFKINLSSIVMPNITLDKKTATVQYKSSSTITAATDPSQGVKWSSSNVKIATVDAAGKVTAVGQGSATITATTEDNLHSANCIVTVKLVWWQWIIKTILFGFLWY